MILLKYRKSNSATVKENSTVSNSPTTMMPSVVVSPPPTLNTPTAPPPNKIIRSIKKKASKPSNAKKSYAQASKANISSKLADEVGKMLKAKNSSKSNKKPRINMTTRGLSRREVIIPMTKPNIELIVNSAYIHTSNINKCLKNSKLDIIIDFIHVTNNGIIITTNKLANNLDLSTIKKYLKNIKNVDLNSIESPHLPKSKSYMKIIGLPYKINQGVITPDFIKGVLKDTHIFKDIVLASKPHIIKASPKSDMAVVWVDI